MSLSDEFVRLARAHAHRRKLKFKRGNYAGPGWRKLGSGWFGEAWSHEDYPNLVVKVSGRGGFGSGAGDHPSRAPLDGWPTFAEYCFANPHPHLPKIVHFERINAATAWAIMPRYMPARSPWTDELRLEWQGWLNGGRGAPEWLWPIIGMASSLFMEVDLHSGNVMLDSDGALIMTDPFSGMAT